MSLYGTPRGICFSPAGDKAYVCVMGGNTLAVFDVNNGHRVLEQIYCGENPRHVICTRDGTHLYVSNNIPGTVTKLDRASGTILGTAKVGTRARTIVLTPDEGYLFCLQLRGQQRGLRGHRGDEADIYQGMFQAHRHHRERGKATASSSRITRRRK